MKKVTITAKVPAKDDQPELGPASVEVDFPETLDEAKQMYGEEAVLSNAFAGWKVTIQGAIRSALKRGESPEAIQARLGNAKMGVAVQRAAMDPEQAFLAKYASATPEEKKAMLKKLQQLAAA